MDNFSFTMDNQVVFIAVFIRFIAAIIFLFSVIPLQIKQANVKNGLYSLRRVLLIAGVLLFHINTIGLIVILFKPFVNTAMDIIVTDIITIFNSVGFLAIAFIFYRIYHEQYTPKNIKLHEEIEKRELNK